MFQKHFGVGAEVNLQPAKSDYGPLQYWQTFTISTAFNPGK
jgi:hypothetical protein